jgi:twitching motility protein PilT
MATRTPTPLLGRLALHNGLITADQLALATQERGRRGDAVRLGDIFVEKGWITEEQLQKLVAKQKELVAKHRAAQALEQAAPTPRTAAPPAERPAAAAPARPAPAAGRGAAAAAARPDPRLEALLRSASERRASDLHLHSGLSARLRRNGRLEEAAPGLLTPELCEALVRSCLDAEQAARFDEEGELDFAYTLPGVCRFRVNAYRQQNGVDAVFRLVPALPPSLEELGLPLALARLTNFHQGMVLVTGPAGCGKSSTLAALIDLVNEERRSHILCIEDPIETLHPSKRCLVNQRQVGPHTRSFARALRAALREDPDVIAIGELRDRETISLALTAAETGHFVLATLHTDNSIRTINRLVGAFPLDQQDQVRTMISESLRAVVSQRLVRRADDSGRVPALEVLQINKAVGNLIRENKTFQIQSILQTGGGQGMQLLDQSLAELVRSGTVDREDALRQAADPKRVSGAGA